MLSTGASSSVTRSSRLGMSAGSRPYSGGPAVSGEAGPGAVGLIASSPPERARVYHNPVGILPDRRARQGARTSFKAISSSREEGYGLAFAFLMSRLRRSPGLADAQVGA